MQNQTIPQDVQALLRSLALESATEAMQRGNLTLAVAIVDRLSK